MLRVAQLIDQGDEAAPLLESNSSFITRLPCQLGIPPAFRVSLR